MKQFIVYPSQNNPFTIQADTYRRNGDLIEFYVGGEIVKTLNASDLLTIVEAHGDERKEA
jgi:hypothetical protein